MGRNLRYQMHCAIDKAFKPGVQKRTAEEEERRETIYAYQSKDNLKDIATNFGQYMKKNHEEIKLLKDVNEEHIKGFLEEKSKNCSSNTVKQYQSQIEKLGVLANKEYGCNINFSCKYDVEEQEKLRNIAMKQEHYNELMKATENSSCQSRVAIEVCRNFGLRVSEVTKIQDRDIKADSLHIHSSKGGRDRDIPITTNEQKEVLERLKALSNDDKNIIKVQNDSINKYLKENLEKLDINDYSESKTGVHSIRKMYAQEQYEERLNNGLDHVNAWGEVSELLGHSFDREDLFHVYCPDFS